jgi:hypothetical protein
MTPHPCIGFRGTEFLTKHEIESAALDLCLLIGSSPYNKTWVVRLQRTDKNLRLREFTWLHKEVPRSDELDWDEVMWQLSLTALEGTRSFDGYVHGDLGEGDDIVIRSSDYADWVRCTHLWHEIREFLGWDHDLIAEFFHILSPPHRSCPYPFTATPTCGPAEPDGADTSRTRRALWTRCVPRWVRRSIGTPATQRRGTGSSEVTGDR